MPDEIEKQTSAEEPEPVAEAAEKPRRARAPQRAKGPEVEAEAEAQSTAAEGTTADTADEADDEAPVEAATARPRRAPRKPAIEEELPESPLTVRAYSFEGERLGHAELPEAIFGVTPNKAVMHQAYLRQQANRRQGTAATKTRGLVSGGGAKPYRQKGTGRARHGSDREPSMVGGGTVFGPQPRSFAVGMPRKMRRLALRSALSVKAEERRVSVVAGFDLEEPRTALIAQMFEGMGIDDTALLVLATPNDMVSRSVSNLPWAKAILALNLNLYDLFTHEHLVIAQDALEVINDTFAAAGKAR